MIRRLPLVSRRFVLLRQARLKGQLGGQTEKKKKKTLTISLDSRRYLNEIHAQKVVGSTNSVIQYLNWNAEGCRFYERSVRAT